MATLVGSWSKDRSGVGAVIVDEQRRVVGIGYNGYPRGCSDHQSEDRTRHLMRAVHAEPNAILNAARTEGCTLYCTRIPCANCAGLIIQAGITRVVAFRDTDFETRWADHVEETTKMFHEADVQLLVVNP